MKELNLSELENVFGGSPESYEAGKSHGEAFRKAIDNSAALGVVIFLLTRGKVKFL